MVAIALRSLQLTADESAAVDRLIRQLATFRASNTLKEQYYEGEQQVRQLGISIPPSMQDIDTVVGWPGTAVDVLEERLDWLGWVAPEDDFGLGDIWRSNDLGTESSLGHLDALIFGVSFVIVGPGSDGEPDPLVTVESPMRMTVEWDRRSRRVVTGFALHDQGRGATLYLPDVTVQLSQGTHGWTVDDRDSHGLGRVPIARLVNRPRGSRRDGRSEITRTIRSLTDQAVRTLMGSEVSREFYAAPQRWVMGADEDAFVDETGKPVPAWQTYLGRVLALSRDEEGELPSVGQFPAASPSPYFEQLRALAQSFAGEAGLPASYLGFQTDNPASADAIKAGEARLLKRAERRQSTFGSGHLETGALCLLVRDGAIPAEYSQVSCGWRDPSTPTRAAATDAAVKLVQAGVLPADSGVTYDLVGLSPSDQQRLTADLRRSRAAQTLTALAAAARAAGEDPAVAGLAATRN